MFPLGTVLLPHGLLPLHVFEERYREMMRHLARTDPPEFGVVLIERGSEVGGGDVRSSIGTVARVLRAAELPDGRWQLVAGGVRRLRVLEWLPDDPYPQATVEDVEDVPGEVDATSIAAHLRRLLALRAEAGETAPAATVELDDDPAVASWQVALLAGLSPLDAQAVLAATGPVERVELLAGLLVEQEELLRFRLSD